MSKQEKKITKEKVFELFYMKPVENHAETLQVAVDELLREVDDPFACYSIALCAKHSAEMVALYAEKYYQASKTVTTEENDHE